MKRLLTALAATTCLTAPALADDERIVVGFATAETGFMQGYDKPAQDAAMIRIAEINAAGGLLGKQIEVVNADTKTDRAEGAKAGLAVIDEGADMVVVSCDSDFGSPAARAAEGRIEPRGEVALVAEDEEADVVPVRLLDRSAARHRAGG